MIAAFGGRETPPSGGGENAVPTAGGLPGSPGGDAVPTAETPYPRRRAKGDRTPSMVSAVAHYPLFRAVRGLNEY